MATKALDLERKWLGTLARLNPVRAKLLTPEQPLRTYLWSSWPEYLKPRSQRWRWLRVDHLLGEYRLAEDTPAAHREMERLLEERRAAEPPPATPLPAKK